jgi:hypothetical protein
VTPTVVAAPIDRPAAILAAAASVNPDIAGSSRQSLGSVDNVTGAAPAGFYRFAVGVWRAISSAARGRHLNLSDHPTTVFAWGDGHRQAKRGGSRCRVGDLTVAEGDQSDRTPTGHPPRVVCCAASVLVVALRSMRDPARMRPVRLRRSRRIDAYRDL